MYTKLVHASEETGKEGERGRSEGVRDREKEGGGRRNGGREGEREREGG